MREQLLKRWPYLVIAVAVLLVWGHTVSFGFVWDDRSFIEESQSIRSFRHVPEMFYSLNAQSSYPEGFVLFRPLRTLHYAVLFALGGGETPKPWLFHLANVLWHAAASLLLYHLLVLVFRKARPHSEGSNKESGVALPLILALAFALHPVASEVVCWAKSLDDLMATTFVLASCIGLLIWNSGSPSNRPYWWALAFFALAVYSKESAVPFAAFSLLIFWWKHGWSKSALRAAVPFFAVACAFVLHRHWVIGRTSQTAPISGTYWQTLVDTLPAAPIYARLLGGIPPFSIDYTHMPIGHPVTALAVLAGLLIVAVAIAGCALLRRPGTRLLGAGFLWLVLFLLPVSNLIPSMQFCAERFLYLPMVGWIVIVGGTLLLLPQRKWLLGTFTAIVVGWAALAWNRSWIWENSVTLFVRSHIEGPTSIRLKDNAVAAVFAQPHMRVVFTGTHQPNKPTQIFANPNAANADWPSIERTVEQLHGFFPNEDSVIMALAVTKIRQDKIEEAIALLEEAAKNSPDSAMCWQNLAQACITAGQTAKAREALRRAVALQPTFASAWDRLAKLQLQEQDYAAATESLKTLRTLQPGNAEYARILEEAESKVAALSTSSK